MKHFSQLIAFFMIINCCHGQNRRFGIVGGTEVGIEDYPYQCGFLSYGGLKCGCSTIAKDCFLTAAHCTAQFDKNISVRVGSSFKHSGGKVYEIDKIINHENFHPVRLHYDFAILKPFETISFDDPNVKRIRLPRQNENISDGTVCRVSGWGKADNNTRPDKLRAVPVRVINQGTCQSNYNTQKVRFRITSQMLCAGWPEGVKDACSGDSGGPLVCDNKQFGVVSSGYGCGLKDFPGIYSRISEIRDWIDENCST